MFNTQIQRKEQDKRSARMGKHTAQTEKGNKKSFVQKKRIEEISETLLAWTALAELRKDWKLQKTAVIRAVFDLDNI